MIFKHYETNLKIAYLVVLQLSPDNSEGIVDKMVIDMNFGQPVGGAGRHPLLVQVVVDHDRSPGRGDALLGSFVTARDKRESYQDYPFGTLQDVVHSSAFFPNALESIICSRFYVCLLLMIVHSICIVSIFVASILRDYLLCANLGELIFVVQSSKKGKPSSAQDLMKPLLPSCTCTIAAAETSMIYRW